MQKQIDAAFYSLISQALEWKTAKFSEKVSVYADLNWRSRICGLNFYKDIQVRNHPLRHGQLVTAIDARFH